MATSTAGNVVLWIAFVFGVLCALGLVLAGSIAVELSGEGSPGAGFGFLFITSWLAILGVLATLTGALGLYLAKWSSRRGWFAAIAGIISLVLGFMFGVPML